MTDVLLMAVVLLAFTVEATLGFGATVVAVTLGAFLVPIDAMLAAFVPLNLVLSTWLAVRYRRHIAWAFLLRRILPWMALGLPFGLLALDHLDPEVARRVFGASVVLLSALELARLLRARPDDAPDAQIAPAPRALLLIAGGFVHGLFATGGPAVVYVAGREVDDKTRFRATLSVLWLILNAVLVIGYVSSGLVGADSAGTTLLLAAPLVAGLVVGEWLHHRIAPRTFQLAVFGALLVAGAILTLP
ncbi:MAG: sulfite exporter TauE/SafE family protein [Deltaproteobacteria bacterium HGW-Deltaproteobacteria-14]|jgi:hypothetical protein|nr:MAG: sulfite exporter TauE/SafE family protein [Deltaproteobacteria bacterium HGW-Deltaproteobacteria-14]